jgi:hypothetical protein
MSPLAMELIRQALRWIGVWLMTTNLLPPSVAELVDDPETVALVAGFVSYALAEIGWIGSKVRK